MDRDKIKDDIKKISDRWQVSGQVILLEGEHVIHQGAYGYGHRAKAGKTQLDTPYNLDGQAWAFCALATLVAIDKGLILMTDCLDKYIPEYKHAKGITISDLIREKVGFKNYYYDTIMFDFNQDKDHLALDEALRVQREEEAYYLQRGFDQVMAMIGQADLEYETGSRDARKSEVNNVFLTEVIQRASGLSLVDFLRIHVFEPIGVTIRPGVDMTTSTALARNYKHLFDIQLEPQIDHIFSITGEDLKNLLFALANKKILSDKMWDLMYEYDIDGDGIILSERYGYHYLGSKFYGYNISIFIHPSNGLSFAILLNESQILEFDQGEYHYFGRDLLNIIFKHSLYPEDTRLEPIKPAYLWQALKLSLEDHQANYVMDAKSAIAMGLLYDHYEVYVQMEGNLVVGLLVLINDPDKDLFEIDIAIIDKKYQGRGFGKHMIQWAVDYLEGQGSKTLIIKLDRSNAPAKAVYEAIGFQVKSVSPGGLVMEKHTR